MTRPTTPEVRGWTATFDEGSDFHGFALRWSVTAPDGESHYGWSEHNAKAIVEAFEKAECFRDLLEQALDTWEFGPGLAEDIGYAIGRIKRWTCADCGCVNGAHEAFCYRCGAGPDPTSSDEQAAPST